MDRQRGKRVRRQACARKHRLLEPAVQWTVAMQSWVRRVKCACVTSNNYGCVGCEFKNNVCVLCGAGKYNDHFIITIECQVVKTAVLANSGKRLEGQKLPRHC